MDDLKRPFRDSEASCLEAHRHRTPARKEHLRPNRRSPPVDSVAANDCDTRLVPPTPRRRSHSERSRQEPTRRSLEMHEPEPHSRKPDDNRFRHHLASAMHTVAVSTVAVSTVAS